MLENAMNHKYNGIPKAFFETCVGVVLMSVVEVGFIFSGNVGTGIILVNRRPRAPDSSPGNVNKA